MIIIIDKKEYAVGLNWFAISSPSELEQFQQEMELHHGIEKMSKEQGAQSVVALCAPEYNGQISLAGMLSFAFSNLIFVTATGYKDDNGQPLYYLCAVKNHAVTVDGDQVGTLDTIVTLYNQNYQDLSADMDPSSIDCYGAEVDENLFPGIHLVEATQVIDQALRYASQSTIKPLGKKALSKGSIILLVAIFAVCSFAVYQFFLKPPPPPPPPPPTAAAPPPPPPPDPYQEFLKSFTQTLSTEPMIAVLPSIFDAISGLPLTLEGWAIETIEFRGSSPDNLTLTLARANFANVDELEALQTKGYFTSMSFDVTGDHAVVTYPFKAQNLTYIQTNVLPSLSRTGSPLYYDLISQLQLYNIPFAAAVGGKNNYFAETNIKLTGEGLWRLGWLSELLSSFKTLGLTSVKISIKDGTFTWTIEGVIYG